MTVQVIKALIEARLNKRGLPTNVRLADIGLTQPDVDLINEALKEKYNHHMEAYLVDSIEDIARILSGNF